MRARLGKQHVDEQADAHAQQHADDSARAGEHDGLGQELPDDVAAPRANRFSHADFARALRDRHQHDVHHADAAHQQSDRADHGGQQRHRTRDLLNWLATPCAVDMPKLSGGVGNVAPAAQHGANFVLRFRHAAREPPRRR